VEQVSGIRMGFFSHIWRGDHRLKEVNPRGIYLLHDLAAIQFRVVAQAIAVVALSIAKLTKCFVRKFDIVVFEDTFGPRVFLKVYYFHRTLRWVGFGFTETINSEFFAVLCLR